MTPHALVIGEALVDVIADTAHPGGSPLNVAIGLVRLGVPTTLATRIGDDHHGSLIRAHLADSGVVLAAGSITAEPTSSAVAVVDPGSGAARYDFDVRWSIPAPEVTGATIVHAGSIAAFLAPGGDVVLDALARARTAGALISVDPNIRPALIGPRAEASVRAERLIGLSHLVKLSDEDADWLYPGWTHPRVLAHLRALGCRVAVITRGADGYTAADVHGVWSDGVGRAVDVVDTIGAGDSFMAGLLSAVFGELATRIIQSDLPPGGWRGPLRMGLEAAAITVQREGADPPRRDEIAAVGAR
ncbi:carbohydrate kinase [Microbacterium sp. 3J1]|uniref:carbohydrate kinase family protein n=1 Tax=Microbacterium sp. 3J1 TaxID=861269 RepID=UPI000A676FF4|nr:carbohydrate kinase [Microbacterium sp. 3J1]